MNTHTGAPRRPVVLIILDGFGVNPSKRNNAIAEANTPLLDTYFARHPHTLLQASGHAVGLPDGQMGNSEVGHLTLGCGAIIHQDLVRIDDAIESGGFYTNPILLAAVDAAAARGRPIHLLGLISDGGVHSHINHALALIKLCHERGVHPLLHMITDGRDTPPQSALRFLDIIEPALHAASGSVATVMGRYYAMDRDQRWDRTERAWRAFALGKGTRAPSARAAIEAAYATGQTDEFIQPVVLPTHQAMTNKDEVISFNFRKDRPRQIVAALGYAGFSGFDRGEAPLPHVTCLMPYDRTLNLPYAFEPEKPLATLGQVISEAGLKQFHCAETEKYAHVTYFFNGGQTEPHTGETQLLIPSPKVATYDLKPQMSAREVAEAVINAIESQKFAFIVVNFANGDMVGHTAIKHAVIQAVETLDREVGRVLKVAETAGCSVILTADHGNCEELVDPASGAPHTQHTTYPVPCLIMDKQAWQLSTDGGLSHIAPTVLQLMGLPQPTAMTSHSLLLKPCMETTTTQPLEGAA